MDIDHDFNLALLTSQFSLGRHIKLIISGIISPLIISGDRQWLLRKNISLGLPP